MEQSKTRKPTRLYSLRDLSKAIGVPSAVLSLKVRAGLITPDFQVRDEALFTAEAIEKHVEQERVERDAERQERVLHDTPLQLLTDRRR